jgi:transposase
MAPLSRSPARIASVEIPSESLGHWHGHRRRAADRCGTWPRRVADPGRGRLREAPGWQTRAAGDPRADPSEASRSQPDGARAWLTVYQLPPYASELNPVEAVWSNLRRSLANLTKQNIDQLTALVKTRLRRMQYRPGLLNGFLAKTRLDLSDPHN